KYQEGKDGEIVNSFREVSKEAISGHVITLNLFNIFHDDFDWESDVAWSGEVTHILQELEQKSVLRHDGHARLLANDKIATKFGYKKKYNVKYKIPDLIIVNSEGITLYPCRDIAYHLHKLDKFDGTFCYNVISKQQQLAQLTVRLALYALGHQDIADKISHFDYEYVSLVGRKMAGREFEYITPDELYEAVKTEIDLLLKERNYTEDESQEISRKVSSSSVKYYILKMDPQKAVEFDVKRAVSLNENTGPFLQYSYARALNILKKAKEEEIDFQTILDSAQDLKFKIEKKEEWDLLLLIEELPSIIVKAVDSLRPDSIANFSYSLASAFHKFYDVCPVLKAETAELMETRMILVYSTIKCLESLFEIMGIDTLERM
ncbi:MAG: arginine--tRNA ligase, partial [Candidatus Thorarchaeota archaeon]